MPPLVIHGQFRTFDHKSCWITLKFSFQNLENLFKSQFLSVLYPPDGRAQRLTPPCWEEKLDRFPLGAQLEII